MQPPECRWALNPLVTLHWRQLDEQWLLFDGGSGGTHWLSELSAAVLRVFAQEPGVPLASLAERVRRCLAIEEDVCLDDAISDQLEQLSRLGLVEPLTTT